MFCILTPDVLQPSGQIHTRVSTLTWVWRRLTCSLIYKRAQQVWNFHSPLLAPEIDQSPETNWFEFKLCPQQPYDLRDCIHYYGWVKKVEKLTHYSNRLRKTNFGRVVNLTKTTGYISGHSNHWAIKSVSRQVGKLKVTDLAQSNREPGILVLI